MASGEHPVELAHFHELARAWPKLRGFIQSTPVRIEMDSGTTVTWSALSAVSQSRGLWELAVSAAAYLVVFRDEPVETDGRTDLAWVVDRLQSHAGRMSLRDFDEAAGYVSALPLTYLYRQAPRLGSVLRKSGPINAVYLSCTAFCLHKHPNDPKALVNCLRNC